MVMPVYLSLIAILCPSLTPPNNGRVKYTNTEFTTGTEAHFSCDNGVIVGNAVSVCQESAHISVEGVWSSAVPTCG